MRIVSPFELKIFAEVEVGELFIRDLRGEPATCIRCATAGSTHMVAILKWGSEPVPSHLGVGVASRPDPVVSFGTGWSLEIVDVAFDVSGGGDRRGLIDMELDGRLSLLTAGVVGGKSRFRLELGGGFVFWEHDELEGVGAVTHWRIWRDETERNRRGSKPLVDFRWPPGGRDEA